MTPATGSTSSPFAVPTPLPTSGEVLRQVRIGPTLRQAAEVVTLPVASPGPGEALVRNHFAGVNGLFDNVIARGELPYDGITLPLDLGVESVGVVAAVGDGVTSILPGEAVAVSRLGAGYRQWVTVPAESAVVVPEASPRLVALRTSAVSALLALEQGGRMGTGEVVVVTAAAGGLGQFLVQLAVLAGNTVVGTTSRPEKVELLRRLGCHRPVDLSSESLADVLDREFDGAVPLVVDTVGTELFDVLVRRLAPRGRLVSAGHASDLDRGLPSPVHQERIYAHLYWKSASVIGFQNVHYPEHHLPAFRRLLDLDAAGRLQVAVDPTPFVGLGAVADAVDHLTSGASIGKVVVDLRPDDLCPDDLCSDDVRPGDLRPDPSLPKE